MEFSFLMNYFIKKKYIQNKLMESPQTLHLIAEICALNKVKFELEYDLHKVNNVDITEKLVSIVISNYNDPELNKILSSTLMKLQETFK